MLLEKRNHGIFGNADLTAGADALYLPGTNQIVCGVPADAEDLRDLLDRQAQRKVIVVLVCHEISPLLKTCFHILSANSE